MQKAILLLTMSIFLQNTSSYFTHEHFHSNMNEMEPQNMNRASRMQMAMSGGGCHRHSHNVDGHSFTHCHGNARMMRAIEPMREMQMERLEPEEFDGDKGGRLRLSDLDLSKFLIPK